MELYRVHRPIMFKHIIGNDAAVKKLKAVCEQPANKRPRAFLLFGPPGCGKTTLAYILANKFGCKTPHETNTGTNRGIDTVRDITELMQHRPAFGNTCNCFIIEEAHNWTTQAMEALLKPVENCRDTTYFFFTTTHPHKINEALRTRFFDVGLSSLTEEHILEILNRVVLEEKKTVPSKVLAKIAELCNKSARRALMLLEQVIYLPESEMINGIQSIVDTEIQSIELCRLMFRKPTPTWKEVSTMLRAMKSANPEDVRNLMLAWMNTALLNGNTRAYVVMTAFTTPYDRTGKAGLSMSCYEALLELSSK